MLHWLRSKNQPEQKSWTLSAPGDDLLALFAGWAPTSSGVAVGVEAALRNPAVACAMRVIAEAIAQLPLVLYERQADGGKVKAEKHPAYALLKEDANAWQSAYDLKLQLQLDTLLHGNGFAFVNRVGGKVRELVRLCPERIEIECNDLGPPRYFVSEGDGRREIAITDLIHIRGLTTDGVRGRSAVKLAAEAIGVSIMAERHAARLFGSGGRPSGLLKLAGKLTPEAVKRIAESWRNAHGGANGGGTAVLEEGADFVPLTFNSVDMQFLEIRKFQIEEIARAFRVPPHLLMELGRATWSNSEEMGRVFLTYTLLPWLEQWEGAIRRAVLSPDERQKYCVEFLVDDFQRADTAARADAYQKLIASRVLNPNEVRAMENRPPYEGGEQFLNPNVTANPKTGGANV